MSKGIIETVAGAALIATGIVLEVVTFGASTPLTAMLITAGAGLVLSGIGTMLAKGPVQGFATTTRNPIAPWDVCYGRTRIGGTIVYLAEFGDSNKWLDMVIVLAAHSCQSVDELLFDNQRVQIGANNTSFTPLQQTVLIDHPSDITRIGDVVTIHLNHDIPLLSDGDQVIVSGVHPVSLGINGKFPVTIIRHVPGTPGSIDFYFLAGGAPIPPGVIVNSGQVQTTWADYKKNVYLESIGDSGPYNRLGHQQTVGETFVGMTNGTPKQGDTGTLVQNNQHNPNPWTNFCSLVGFTAVHIRLEYDSQIFPGGIPQISFLLRGKNDIVDPRTSPPTVGYTENAALCIADYLTQQTWGFKYVLGTDVSIPGLIAAANVCDEPVGLASPLTSPLTTEPRYTCCGHFNLTMKRGEILQNLLTSCGGRIVPDIFPIVIYPAIWPGVSLTLAANWIPSNAAGPIRWRSSVTIAELFNGVKGTYISPANNWQSSDFPRYAQDSEHGYNDGPPQYDYDQNLANDGGDRRWLDIQLPFTISCAAAQRLAKIELLRRRQQGTGTFLLNMVGYQIAPLDILAVSLAYFGWDDKLLEVLASRFKLEKQNDAGAQIVLLGVEIDVQETDPSVYDWEIIEELSPQGFQYPGLPNTVFTPDPPTNLHVIFDDSGGTALAWTAPLDPYVTTIQGRYQLIASPPGIWISLGTVDDSVTQMPLPVLLPGTQYVLELRSVNRAGVPSIWVSLNYTPLPIPPQWQPYEVQAAADDAMYPLEHTFDVALGYSNLIGAQVTLADGGALPRLNVTGVEPVNEVIDGCPAPIITAARVVPTGGAIQGGIILYVSVTADDGNGNYTLPSAVFPVEIPQSSPPAAINSVQLDVTWPNFPGLVNFTIYAYFLVDVMGAQQTGALTPTSPVGGYNPGTITLLGFVASPPSSPPDGALLRSTYAAPNPNLRTIRLKATIGYHLGVIGAAVDSVVGSSVVSKEAGDPTGEDNWVGRQLIIIGRDNANLPLSSIPFWAANILSYDPSTGTFGLDRVADGIVLPGDVFVVSTLGYNNSADPYRITDSGWSNALNYDFNTRTPTPHSGLTPDLERGMVLRVIKGTSRGAKANIIANTGTTHILDSPITIGPDSVWIIVEAGWPYVIDSTKIDTASPFQDMTVLLPISDFAQQSIFLAAFLIDVTGEESEDGDGPFRMVFVFGSQAALSGTPFTVVREGYATLTINDLQVTEISTIGAVKQVQFEAPVVDESDSGWWGIGAIDDVTDPYTFVPSYGGSSRLGKGFGVGDYIVWNDTNYEIDLIIAVGDDGALTVQRNPGGGVPTSQAQFGSTMKASFGTFFRATSARALSEATPNSGATGVPAVYEWAFANRMPLAVTAQAIGSNGIGPLYTLNLSRATDAPPAPGLRLLNGAQYNLGALGVPLTAGAGGSRVGTVADKRIQVRAPESVTAMSADLATPSTGLSGDATVIVYVVYITPDRSTAGLLEILKFGDGAFDTYLAGNPPEGRNMPYHSGGWAPYAGIGRDWPPNVLPVVVDPFDANGQLQLAAGGAPPVIDHGNFAVFAEGGWIDFIVTQVGMTTPGQDLGVTVRT